MDVLVVGSCRDTYQDIKRILSEAQLGASVRSCDSSALSSQTFSNGILPDFMFFDLDNIGIRSIEQALTIAAAFPNIHTVIMASVSEDPRKLLRVLDHGADDYIFKPIDKKDLLQLRLTINNKHEVLNAS